MKHKRSVIVKYMVLILLAGIAIAVSWTLANGTQTQSNINVSLGAQQTNINSEDLADFGWLEIHFYPCDKELDAPGEILLTDPLGRRVGWDNVQAKVLIEIEGAYYEDTGIDDCETGEPGPVIKELGVKGPVEGKYRLSVFGSASRLYGFAFNFSSADPAISGQGASVENIRINRGEVHVYEFNYIEKNGNKLELKRVR